MEIKNKKFISQVNKSKLLYAFSLVDNLVNSEDSKIIKKDLDLVWKISGFKSKKKFEDLFKVGDVIYVKKIRETGLNI